MGKNQHLQPVRTFQVDRLADQRQAKQTKQRLIEQYQQQRSPSAESEAVVTVKSTDDLSSLKRQVRQLRRQLKQQTQRQQQKQDQWQSKLTGLTAKLQRSQTDLRLVQQQIGRLKVQLSQQQRQQSQLQTELMASQQLVTTIYQYAALGRLLIARANTQFKAVDRLRQQQLPKSKPVKLSKTDKNKLVSYDGMMHHLTRVRSRVATLEAENDQLYQRQLSLNQQLRERPSDPLSLAQRVQQMLKPANIRALQWLPQAAAQYRQLIFDNIVIGDGRHVYGYFVAVKRHHVFKTINGATFRHYQFNFTADKQPNDQAVYAGIIHHNMIIITKIYRHLTPHELNQQHSRQLHRRAARKNYRELLPADAMQKLKGQVILIVTWQRAQTLTQALRSFGAVPIVVNDQEKSIPWLKGKILSQQVAFTLLLSEGVSHSLLSALGKPVINQRPDIELVYNESPEELIARCYRFFSCSMAELDQQ